MSYLVIFFSDDYSCDKNLKWLFERIAHLPLFRNA